MYKGNFIICLLLFFIGISSCYDENNRFGEKLVDSSFRTVVSDSSTVTVTIKKIDSLETSGKNIILVGNYTHPLWGKISTRSFIPFSRPTYSVNREQTVVFDSLMLDLKFNPTSYFMGDTLQRFRINVHELTQRIRLNDEGYLYSYNSVNYDPEPMGTYAFRPSPKAGGKVSIRLADELGEKILTALHTNNPIASSEQWEYFFNGLCVTADEAMSEAIISYPVNDSTSVMKLYYHLVGETAIEQELQIVPNATKQFNNIEYDASGTLIEPYADVRRVEIPSSRLDDRGFMFAGLGWFTRLDFPYLNVIMQQGQEVSIDKATLIIYPDANTYSDFNVLPDSIYLYIADENNVVNNAVTDYLGTSLQTATLVKNSEAKHNTYFYFDLTSFLQQELGAIGRNKNNLQMVFNSDTYTGSFKNLTFYDKNGEFPLTLQLTYTVYESY